MAKNIESTNRPTGSASEQAPRPNQRTFEIQKFDIIFDVLRFAAIKHPSVFSRDDVFSVLCADIKIRTQQRILQNLCDSGYLQEHLGKGKKKFYSIRTRAFIPFIALASSVASKATDTPSNESERA